MQFLSKILIPVDLLSPDVELYLNGSKKLRNPIGGLLTLGLIILSITAMTYFCYISLSRQQPITSQGRVYTNEPRHFINSSETPFYFRISDRVANPIPENERVYSVRAQFWTFEYVLNNQTGKRDQKSYFKELKLSKCPANFTLNSKDFEVFSTFSPDDYYCLDPNQTFEIFNPFSSRDGFTYINLYFSKCGGNRKNCKDIKEIDTILTSFNVQIVMKDNYADNLNYTNPITPYVRMESMLTSASYFKRRYMNLQRLTYFSDDGFIMESINTYSDYSFAQQTEVLDFRTVSLDANEGQLLFQATISYAPDGLGDSIKRQYKKLQNVLAEIGGFINTLVVASQVILYFSFSLSYLPGILRDYSVYEYEAGENFHHSRINLQISQSVPVKSAINRVVKVALPTKTTILCSHLCSRKNTETMAYNKIKKLLISEYLDIRNFINLKSDIDLLKYCIIEDKKLIREMNLLNKVLVLNRHERIESELSLNRDQFDDKIKKKISEFRDTFIVA